jgi:threonine/homoserine/homoserine lactone efflux protein
MGMKESFRHAIWILVGINVAMMGPVITTPFLNSVLASTSPDNGKNDLEGRAG